MKPSRIALGFPIFVLLGGLPGEEALAWPDGNFSVYTYTTGSGCNACHGQVSTYQPQTSVNGPDEIVLDTWVPFSLTLAESGAPFPAFGGFQLSATNGSVRPLDPGVHMVGATLAHSAPASFSGDDTVRSVTWTFEILGSVVGNIGVQGPGRLNGEATRNRAMPPRIRLGVPWCDFLSGTGFRGCCQPTPVWH
jgi:hypothetical protein